MKDFITRFGPDELLAAYAAGVFPMADSRDDPEIYLVEPAMRAVLPLDRFRLSSRLARTVRQDRFAVSVSTDFEAVLDACAEPAPGREDTWINAAIRELYLALHARGAAHSVECRLNGALVGGLYGVTLGGAFFGEACSAGRPTPQRSPWSIWWRG
nr:leucyl/phenylalanyl-tRNA--protein transferase [Brevundimonas denitrificans]